MTFPNEPAAGFLWDQAEDRADMCGPGSAVAFARGRARSGLMVSLFPGEPGLEIVRAVESDPERDHPGRVVSPVYQELQRHQGAAGSGSVSWRPARFTKHHFSAVITL